MDFQNVIQSYIENSGFPCVGAKTALSKKLIRHFVADSLDSASQDEKILESLKAFIDGYHPEEGPFGTFILLFPKTPKLSEDEFEEAMWRRLSALHELDPHGWDPSVSSDPEESNFSFSLLGKAFYIVGMHPESGRRARRFPMAALVFNLHSQFEKLRESGQYGTMRQIIRRRDKIYSGSVNPMLENFGAGSEARQYSGREVPSSWKCPFHQKDYHVESRV